MSWRTGAELFREVYPLVRARVPKAAERREFLAGLLQLFLDWDVEPADVADVHAEVRAALAALGHAVEGPGEEGDDVAGCERQLRDPAEEARAEAAAAIEFFVHQAKDPTAAAGIAFRALAGALADASPKVRRAAAGSLDTLLADGFSLPAPARKRLAAAAADADEVVRRRVAKALARLPPKGKRG